MKPKPRYRPGRQVDLAIHDPTSPSGWIPAFAGMTRWVGRRAPQQRKTARDGSKVCPHYSALPPRVTLGLDPRALYFKMSAMGGFVYILANMRRGRTYIGVTNDLLRRVYEHREGLVEGYTKSRDIKRLVYFEQHDDITTAIQRETSLKRWYSHWKHALIEEDNPEWRDLWDDIVK